MRTSFGQTTISANYSSQYKKYVNAKIYLFLLFLSAILLLALFAVSAGTYKLDVKTVLETLIAQEKNAAHTVIWSIRLPRILAAIIAGWSLGLAGAVMQCLLKNPLASPFTLGISQGAAFGAAFAIVVLGAGGATGAAHVGSFSSAGSKSFVSIQNVYLVTICAFLGALVGTLAIIALARIRKMAAESIILAGVALSSLFVSGTVLVQYYASEAEIASVVFWTFGDVSRSNWREIWLMSVTTTIITGYFVTKQWDLNALSSGDDVATALGVNVNRARMLGMVLIALVASLVTAFLGVIAFLGLLAPHIARRLVGGDHRFLIPHSCIIGAGLLLGADTFGRILIGSGTLPVGVLTSFMGAPLFLYLLIKGKT